MEPLNKLRQKLANHHFSGKHEHIIFTEFSYRRNVFCRLDHSVYRTFILEYFDKLPKMICVTNFLFDIPFVLGFPHGREQAVGCI